MGNYLVLIYGDERRWSESSDQWHEENATRHRAFNVGAGAAVLEGHELEPTTKAISLRPNAHGRPCATDGPFVETKEAIGGYYLLEAPDLETAIEVAGRIPEASTAFSGVEIRPIRT